MAAVAGDMTSGDVGINLDFDCGEDVSTGDSYKVILRHRASRVVTELVGVNLPSANYVRYATTVSTGAWERGKYDVQVEITFPTSKPKRTQPLYTMTVGESI